MKTGRPDTQFRATRDVLRAEVAKGFVDPLGMLPGERDLAKRFAVSRTTMRRVLAALVDEGVLFQRQGVGTFRVASTGAAMQPVSESPSSGSGVTGLAAIAARRGLRLRSEVLREVQAEPLPEEAMLLGCAPEHRIKRLSRIRYLDNEPVVCEETMVPEAFWTDPLMRDGSVHAALALGGIHPIRAVQSVRAAAASTIEAETLHLQPGLPVIHLRRGEYLKDGRCCLFTRATFRADSFDRLVELPIPIAAPRAS